MEYFFPPGPLLSSISTIIMISNITIVSTSHFEQTRSDICHEQLKPQEFKLLFTLQDHYMWSP